MLNRCTGLNLYPGFESLPHRQIPSLRSEFGWFGKPSVTPRARRAHERERGRSHCQRHFASFAMSRVRHVFRHVTTRLRIWLEIDDITTAMKTAVMPQRIRFVYCFS